MATCGQHRGRLILAAWLGLGSAACSTSAASDQPCATDADCAPGSLCVNGACFDSRNDDPMVACSNDGQCTGGQYCAATGFCETRPSGLECTVTADCPSDQYCNFNLEQRTCVPLQSGACRDDSQCTAGRTCSAISGGVGRCVECMSGADCASGRCGQDGTCVPVGVDAGGLDAGGPDTASFDAGNPGGCTPACDTAAGETCEAGICYGPDGCPRHAHAVGAGCACDSGYIPNSAGTECVLASTGVDAGGFDANTGYDAGGGVDSGGETCSPPCNAAAGEFCFMGQCYDAEGCPEHAHSVYGDCVCDDGYEVSADGLRCEPEGTVTDPCEVNHLYNDGVCHTQCLNHDPDCDTEVCPPHSHVQGSWCVCDSGYVVDNTGQCVLQGSGGLVGDACSDDDECAFSASAFCATTYPGGYCSSVCRIATDCGYNAACNCMDGSCSQSFCFENCRSDTDCRPAYYCDFWTWVSAAGGGFCVPR